jgi:hypothetical protein
VAVGPTIGERITLAYITIVLGLVASALYLVVFIVVWRQGRRGPILLSLTGLAAIAVGLTATGAVRLVGLTRGTDTSDLALGIQFGATAIALALLSLALVSHRRRTPVH